jgi:hypothetical protein
VAFGGEEGYGAQVMCSECWIMGDDEPSNSDLPKNVGNDFEVGIDENNEEEGVEKNSRKRKAYTIGFKLEAVKFAKQISNHSASKKFNVTRSRVQEWMKTENEFPK